jgi:hypothetical protein
MILAIKWREVTPLLFIETEEAACLGKLQSLDTGLKS